MRVGLPATLQGRKLTLFGRALALVSGEVLANAVCWIAAALIFRQGDGLLGLALLAWVSRAISQPVGKTALVRGGSCDQTIGLRHGEFRISLCGRPARSLLIH